MAADRRALLYAALACAQLTSREPELAGVRLLLDSWRGIGLIVQRRLRHGYRVSITNVAEAEWRTTFMSHPMLSPDGFAVDRVPWRAVQNAAWRALNTPLPGSTR